MGGAVEVPEEISAALARGATVLTGKQRAARWLGRTVDRANRVAGVGTWAPARVFAWDAWTSGLWHRMLLDGHVERMLLNRTQERAIWTATIGGDDSLSTLLSAGSLAGLAEEAWGTLARFGGLGRLRGSATNPDTEAFVRWAEVFEGSCRDRGYLPRAALEGALRRAWRERPGSLPAERELLLVGFDRLLPAQVKLLDALRQSGCSIREQASGPPARRRTVVAAADEAEERLAAAEWARDLLAARPGARLAMLVPGLQENALERAAIDRTLRAVVAPERQAMVAGSPAPPYEFSTGVTLDRTAMGMAALALLGWTEEAMGLDELGALLLSAYFAGGGEGSARAEFDAYELRGRTMLRPEISLDELTGRVERSERRERLGAMLACLRRMQAVVRRRFRAVEQQSYTEWSEAMRDLLEAAGWAGGDAVDRVEFQTSERLESALDELATLDFEGGRVVYARALEALRGIAERTTFAPESREAPLQIMGPEEAAGLRFDAVWMMRAGDLSWPAAAAASVLLAWPLRRELSMPGSDVAEDAEKARRVTERIAAAGGEAVFSYARQTADGQQRASAVLGGLGLSEAVAEPRGRARGAPVALEVVKDAPRLPALPDGEMKGGVSVLKAQAACAFHAFAEYRLFATELESRDAGLNASERGQAVHGMLEHFWAEVETQADLKAMTTAAREAALGRAIEATLGRMKIDASGATDWEVAYLDAQRRGLLRLGGLWLDLEAQRATPFRVARRESEEKNVAVGPLNLTLRLDRVDATGEGAVLIDYKTGPVGAGAWQGDRPDEPQLPLYAALAGETRLHAVAFGMVRAGEGMKLSGYAQKPGTLTGRSCEIEADSLEEQVERWSEALEGLAASFAAGDARVSPKAYPETCKDCAHRLICRLDAGLLNAEDGDDEDSAGEDERG